MYLWLNLARPNKKVFCKLPNLKFMFTSSPSIPNNTRPYISNVPTTLFEKFPSNYVLYRYTYQLEIRTCFPALTQLI